ncbi:hypothetical protein PQX77_009289 [Marasmius sp. AFHP31]|nr:hypothetical protein PQX77_009289 [Marasmius sp. AFHP31]
MDLKIADFVVVLAAIGVALTLYLRWFPRPSSSLSLPPGPKRLPLIGNFLQLPTSHEWETYHRWCKELDTDILCLDAAGVTIIVLDSLKAAEELIEKRSMTYSSRPHSVMLNELLGQDRNFGGMKYGGLFPQANNGVLKPLPDVEGVGEIQVFRRRNRRRLFDQMFNPTASKKYQPQEATATRELLQKLCEDPENYTLHLRHHAAKIILSIAYGIEVLPENDPYVALAEEGVRILGTAQRPGAYLVESIPLLKYVPEWFPGAAWKRRYDIVFCIGLMHLRSGDLPGLRSGPK